MSCFYRNLQLQAVYCVAKYSPNVVDLPINSQLNCFSLIINLYKHWTEWIFANSSLYPSSSTKYPMNYSATAYLAYTTHNPFCSLSTSPHYFPQPPSHLAHTLRSHPRSQPRFATLAVPCSPTNPPTAWMHWPLSEWGCLPSWFHRQIGSWRMFH